MTELSFDGRVAVVTGAGRGLGRAYAVELARRGAAVVVNDLGGAVEGGGRDESVAGAVVDEIRSLGGRAEASTESVATPDGAEKLIGQAMESYGSVDVLIHNAGIVRFVSFPKTTPEVVDAHLDVHLRGAFYLAWPAYRVMRERNFGRMVFISSAGGLFGTHGLSAYGAAKAGVVGLANVLAIEGARHGVRVNVVAPWALGTRMSAGDAEHSPLPAQTEERVGTLPVVPMVTYLASDACSVTGEVFSAGAGRYARIVIAAAQGWQAADGELASAEDIRSHLDEIRDTTNIRLYASADEEMRDIFPGDAIP